MAQVLEFLPHKHEARSSNTSTEKKKSKSCSQTTCFLGISFLRGRILEERGEAKVFLVSTEKGRE
jgi:hypothetical protein